MQWVVAFAGKWTATVDHGDLPAQLARGGELVGPVVWDGTERAPMGPYITFDGPWIPRPPAVKATVLRASLTEAQRKELVADALRIGVEKAGRKWGMSGESVKRVMREANAGRRRG